MFGRQNFTAQRDSQPFRAFGQSPFLQTNMKMDYHLSAENSSNSPFWFDEHQKTNSCSREANTRPQFLRLDSTGDQEKSSSSLLNQAQDMFNFHTQQSRDIGFGQRYTRCPRLTPLRTMPRQTNIGNQPGYPFHQFAMATGPREPSVKFYSHHGDTQILNMAHLNPWSLQPHTRMNSPHHRPCTSSPLKSKTRKVSEEKMKPQPTTPEPQKDSCNDLCEAVEKMTVDYSSSPVLVNSDDLPTNMTMSTAVIDDSNQTDSGFEEPLPSTKNPFEPNGFHFVESCPDELQMTAKPQIECIEVCDGFEVTPSFLTAVINLDYDESDTDSELDVSDTFSFFDSETDSEIDDGDPCSRSAEFELLSCFFPDDKYNPMNFNGTCSSMPCVNNKRASSTSEDEMDASRPRKRVRFVSDASLAEIHEEDTALAPDYQDARCGPWENYARSRERFLRRVAELDPVISPVLAEEHRRKLWNTVHS